MVRFQKFFDFSAFHFPKEQENAWSDMNFLHLKSIYCARITLKISKLIVVKMRFLGGARGRIRLTSQDSLSKIGEKKYGPWLLVVVSKLEKSN